VYLYVGLGECPFHCDAVGTTALNALYEGEKLWICISHQDILLLIRNNILTVENIAAVNDKFPTELLQDLQQYEGETVTIWYGRQQQKQTIIYIYICHLCLDIAQAA
jgi:hypothetical protein